MTLSSQAQIRPHPFVKWVGGKRKLLPQIREKMPQSFNIYFEPFLGGGSLFFSLQPTQAVLSDNNPELINLYHVIQQNVHGLIEDLKKHKNTKDYYESMRQMDRNETNYQKLSAVEKASRLLFLNKTCFNGLYRVNQKGQFNVPFGQMKQKELFQISNLLACEKILKKAQIFLGDFQSIMKKTQKNDFVYFDPPYDPISKTSAFTQYTKKGFPKEEQKRLKQICDELTEKSIFFLLSNSSSPFILDLYQDYQIDRLWAARSINSNPSKRKAIEEILVSNVAIIESPLLKKRIATNRV